MAREIKFRAWHPALQKMFYNCRVSSKDWLDDSTHFCGEHDTLMQYTGLHDKNGMEIYEGDIIQISLPDLGIEKEQVVEWNDEKASYGTMLEEWHREVIGNIWENPELVGAKPSGLHK